MATTNLLELAAGFTRKPVGIVKNTLATLSLLGPEENRGVTTSWIEWH